MSEAIDPTGAGEALTELRRSLGGAPCYTGPDADPEELRALRTAKGLVDDAVGAHSFLAQQHVFSSGYGVDRNYWKGHFVRELPGELIDELLERIVALGRPPGGLAGRRPRRAIHRVGARHGGGPQAMVGRRRLHELHAGRRAHRACARRLAMKRSSGCRH